MDILRKVKKFGAGTDIETIDRFRKFKNRNDSFLKKVFTSEELKYCFSHQDAAPHLAVRFSGKEAMIKALILTAEGIRNDIYGELQKHPPKKGR